MLDIRSRNVAVTVAVAVAVVVTMRLICRRLQHETKHFPLSRVEAHFGQVLKGVMTSR